jgi:hypothetical protein
MDTLTGSQKNPDSYPVFTQSLASFRAQLRQVPGEPAATGSRVELSQNRGSLWEQGEVEACSGATGVLTWRPSCRQEKVKLEKGGSKAAGGD